MRKIYTAIFPFMKPEITPCRQSHQSTGNNSFLHLSLFLNARKLISIYIYVSFFSGMAKSFVIWKGQGVEQIPTQHRTASWGRCLWLKSNFHKHRWKRLCWRLLLLYVKCRSDQQEMVTVTQWAWALAAAFLQVLAMFPLALTGLLEWPQAFPSDSGCVPQSKARSPFQRETCLSPSHRHWPVPFPYV